MDAKSALPQVGFFACFSGGSNSGSLAGMGALEVVRRLGSQIGSRLMAVRLKSRAVK